MIHINIITLFPEFFQGPLSCGLMQRAREAGHIAFRLLNPRDLTTDRHHTVDDRPYGGGPGMVMMAEPMAALLRSLGFGPRGQKQPGRLVFLTPKGQPFTQHIARTVADALCGAETGALSTSTEKHPLACSVSEERSLTLICGRYEGLDARIEEIFPVECWSVGDFVLNGGEAAALCVIEAIARLVPGYMGHEDSGEEESFSAGVLEYPHYTRPDVFEGHAVPKVLLSGDHGAIARWRRQAALAQTLESRPELLQEAALEADDIAFLQSLPIQRCGRNLYLGLVHYPVLDKMRNSIAVSLTNLDIHDIARSSCTYGLGGYYVLTPLQDQRELLTTLVGHWTKGPGKQGNPHRDKALSLVRSAESIAEAVSDIQERTGCRPYVVATSARPRLHDEAGTGFRELAACLQTRPVLLVFGTGHGLAPQALELCDAVLPPIRLYGGYNHLSVRSAVAIILDRILGDWH